MSTHHYNESIFYSENFLCFSEPLPASCCALCPMLNQPTIGLFSVTVAEFAFLGEGIFLYFYTSAQ